MINDNNYAVDGALGILGDGGVQTLFSRIAENGANQTVNQSGRILNKQFYKRFDWHGYTHLS